MQTALSKFLDQRVKGIMRMPVEIDFRFRLKLKITLVESTYPSQFIQCISLSPHFLLVLVNIFISLWKSVWKFTTGIDKMCIDLMRNTSLFDIGSIIIN